MKDFPELDAKYRKIQQQVRLSRLRLWSWGAYVVCGALFFLYWFQKASGEERGLASINLIVLLAVFGFWHRLACIEAKVDEVIKIVRGGAEREEGSFSGGSGEK